MKDSKTPLTGQLTFHQSEPAPCPYIDGQTEQTLFTVLYEPDGDERNSELTSLGFRRSQNFAYRPFCPNCNACKPVRIPLDGFSHSGSQRRLVNRNADIDWSFAKSEATNEQYKLFRRYQQGRHAGGSMETMTFGEYRQMVTGAPVKSSMMLGRRRDDGELLAAMYFDELDDGGSAVYSFFTPDEPKRGLGTVMVLALADRLRERGGSYLYLGYWIGGCAKMSYKSRYRPLEILTDAGWIDFHEDFTA